MQRVRWYAAFHDKKTNPHVHIIVYSANEREGFLTNRGIEKIRGGFANDIYQDELHHLYQRQTDLHQGIEQDKEPFAGRRHRKCQIFPYPGIPGHV